MRPRTEALAAIHETMTALHQTGIIDDKTMRRFDKACLTPVRPRLVTKPKPSLTPVRLPQLPEPNRQPREQVGARRKATLRRVTETINPR